MAKVARLDSRTLRERSTSQIRQMVVAGRLEPGEHIVEVRLSEDLGVSRSTLRESLRALEVEGLLVGDGRGHLLVRKLSSRQVLEVFEVREALEVVAATRVAQRLDVAVAVAKLRQSLDPLRDTSLGFAQQIEYDLGFHRLLCELSGNDTLLESWQRLMGQLEMVIVGAGPIRAADRMRYEEHDVIVAAIETGDITHAEATVRSHMRTFCKAYVADAIQREADAS